MKEVLDEYGEVVAGVIAAFAIIGIGVFIFSGDGTLHEYFSSIVNGAI